MGCYTTFFLFTIHSFEGPSGCDLDQFSNSFNVVYFNSPAHSTCVCTRCRVWVAKPSVTARETIHTNPFLCFGISPLRADKMGRSGGTVPGRSEVPARPGETLDQRG